MLNDAAAQDAHDVLAGLGQQVPGQLAAALRNVTLVDHHVHGCFIEPLTREQFERAINEGSPDPVPKFMTQFDSQLGFAIRRWCAPRLGLPAHASADEYWAKRGSLSTGEINRIFLGDAGVEHWVVDTGFSPEAISSPAAVARDSGRPSAEVLRLELIAEALLDDGVPAADFAAAYRSTLEAASRTAVGFKTIVAYRTGFDIEWSAPADGAVERAVSAWRTNSPGAARLNDPVIIAFLIHSAAELGLPLQFHTGFGDRDLDLHRSNPMLLLPLLRQPSIAGTPIMLLHCYPYHREAGYLAQAFDNVYFDIGLSANYVGAQSTQLVAESLETTPFAKQLYSSDAFGLPELHFLGSVLWRRAMGQTLGGWVRSGDWSETEAIRVVDMIGRGNARRVYGLAAHSG
jgi:hypothetical protein